MIDHQGSIEFQEIRTDIDIEFRQKLIEKLTPRELEILGLVCDGHSNDEISMLFDIRLSTVKYHVNNIFGKLCVSRRTQAVAVAVHLRLVKPGWLCRDVSWSHQHLLMRQNPLPGMRLVGLAPKGV